MENKRQSRQHILSLFIDNVMVLSVNDPFATELPPFIDDGSLTPPKMVLKSTYAAMQIKSLCMLFHLSSGASSRK